MVFDRKLRFLPSGFLGKPGQKRSFFNILDRKECFVDQKSKVSKTSEKSNFSKGLAHVFVKISSFLPCGFFRQTKVEKIAF